MAETEYAAKAAARAVVVNYVDLPAVVTVAEALQQGSVYDMGYAQTVYIQWQLIYESKALFDCVLKQLFAQTSAVPPQFWTG